MAKYSISESGNGTTNPSDIEAAIIAEDYDRPKLVVLWHGNEYKRADCWIQADSDAVCDLDSWK